MRLRIVAKHTELSESLKKFAQEKAEKLEKHFDRVTQAQLILSPDFVAKRPTADADAGVGDDVTEPGERHDDSDDASGHVGTAELILNVPGEKKPLVAHARGENFRAAIDLVLDKMERQLTKHKEKRQDHRQPRGQR